MFGSLEGCICLLVGQPASSQPAWSSKARLRKRDSPFRPISPRKSIHIGGWCEDEELEEEPENGGGYYYTTAVVFQTSALPLLFV